MRRFLTLAATIAALGLASGDALAQGQERPAVDKGVAFLKSKVATINVGESGITALALIKAGVPADDPALGACLFKIGSTLSGGSYAPEKRGGPEIYETAVCILALVNIDHIGYKQQIDAMAQNLIGKQYANGSWDYSDRTQGDESMTQYALLALWEAESAGIIVPPQVWDKAAAFYLSVQSSAGSWTYHRDMPNQGETLSMTAAGVGSLMLCQKQLVRHRKGQDLMNPLMIPVTIDGKPAESVYKVETSRKSIDDGIAKGISWINSHFVVAKTEIMGQSPYYCLYGMERLNALGQPTPKDPGPLDPLSWYNKGLQFALANQEAAGSWNAQHDQVPNTCWAILFSVKATTKSLHNIEVRRLSGGLQKGEEGLPADLSNVDVINGKIVVRPMGGAIEGMLAVLEDPSSKSGQAALAGLVKEYQTQGPKVLRPLKDRFRKLLKDPDPGIRVIACWGLGRTADLDVAPVLIKTLLDDDKEVVQEARRGLQVLSRKLEGFGPAEGATPDECRAAAKKWQAWFESVKPPDLDAPDELIAGPAKAPAPKQ